MPDDTAIQFQPRRAKREGVGLFIGLASGTGGGKTYSALTLARGIVGPKGRILAGDTEGRRMSHYADQFEFDVVDILPPFRPEKFEALVKYAEANKYDVVIIDSFSHEWAGDGGVLEWHDEELDRAVAKAMQFADPDAINEDSVRDKNNMRGWIKPKAAHKQMVNSFLQRRIPIIFCLRAEEKVKVGAGGKPQPMGWMPICDKNFGYELTCMITLSNENPGKVDYKLPRKIQQQHLAMFPDGKVITAEAGAKLAAWARGDDVAGESDRTTAIVNGLLTRILGCDAATSVDAILDEDIVKKQMEWMKAKRRDQFDRLMLAADARIAELQTKAPEPEPDRKTEDA